jgi:four helix bundle protein
MATQEAQAAARGPIRSYEDIEAYQRAMKLVVEMHDLVKRLPSEERYDLGAQIRRGAKSIPANIAEGCAKRSSVKEFKKYLRIAMASANEMEVHLKIAAQLGYLSQAKAEPLVQEYVIVGKQLNRLITVWRQLQTPASSLQHRG